jgi:hypothetical protein
MWRRLTAQCSTHSDIFSLAVLGRFMGRCPIHGEPMAHKGKTRRCTLRAARLRPPFSLLTPPDSPCSAPEGGWESSAQYYRIINQEVRARLGGEASPAFVDPSCLDRRDSRGLGPRRSSAANFYHSQHEFIGVFRVGKAPHLNNIELIGICPIRHFKICSSSSARAVRLS